MFSLQANRLKGRSEAMNWSFRGGAAGPRRMCLLNLAVISFSTFDLHGWKRTDFVVTIAPAAGFPAVDLVSRPRAVDSVAHGLAPWVFHALALRKRSDFLASSP